MIDTIWVDNLIKIFEYEIKIYTKVLQEVENKKNVIINGDVESLQATVVKEQRYINELNKLVEAADKIIAHIAKITGKKCEDINISYLIGIAPAKEAKKLSSKRDELNRLIEQIREKNELNQKLINNSIEYVNFSLNLLTQTGPQTTQYGSTGNTTQAKDRNVLDIKY
ncbi:MAG TPA: flagellar protein FlgN [Thermoclostridium sp.]|nr:flagellar protein FlgN [Thermoclostridium sp.]